MIDYFIHIDDYTNGRLTESAKEAFEAEMSINEELRLAVDNHDIMDLVVDMAWEDDARQVAVDALKGTQQKEAKIMRMRKLMAVAASFLVVLFAGYFLMGDVGTKNSKLYAEFYSPYQGSQIRGANTNSNLALCEQGHLLLEKKQYEKSIEVFKQSILNKEECTQKSQWYLALAYLQQENESSCNSILEDIVRTDNHDFKEVSTDLLDRLR